MRKKFSFFIVLQFLVFTVSIGQTNTFEYSDTAIYRIEASEEKDYEINTYDDVIKIPDTTLQVWEVVNLKDSIQQWKRDKNLAYLQQLDSLLARQQAKEEAALNNNIDKAEKGLTFFGRLFSSSFFQMFLWLIAASALFFILYKLFLSKGLFSKTDKEINKVQELPEDELLQLGNYDKLIEDAMKNADFRLATRYLFLQSLKHMADKEIIIYAADKTNRDYLQQLPENLKFNFRNIARHYDYIWYGHQTLDEKSFQHVRQLFNEFNQAL